MASKLPHGPLRTLLAAWLLVSAGGWAFVIAVAVYAFHASGAGAVGVVTAARLLPATLAAPLIGGLIDRGDRARVVAIACAAQAGCLAAAAVLVLGSTALALVVVLAALSSIAAIAPRPALQALMPALASSPDELTRATAMWGAIAAAAVGVATLEAGWQVRQWRLPAEQRTARWAWKTAVTPAPADA